MGSCCCCCIKRKRKMTDPVPALAKRPLIEVLVKEPLIPTHSLGQIHRCYHHTPNDNCKKAGSPTVILSNWFKNLNNLYIALYDFIPMEIGDLRLIRGDIVELIDSSGEWWLVKKVNQEEGHVPSNYLGHLFLRSWYYGKITRAESESILMGRSNGNEDNFLIRESETRNNYLTLSIKFQDDPNQPNEPDSVDPTDSVQESAIESAEEEQVKESLMNGHKVNCSQSIEVMDGSHESQEVTIKHYLIHCTVDGIYYIHPEVSFNSLDDLVIFYSNQKHCLCCKLILVNDDPTPKCS